jgi:uncharacterized protein YbjT (DUF2867 family)
MLIAIFGGTGGTGRQVIEQGLAQGHQISALVRDPNKLEERPGLVLHQGDVLDLESTARCLEGAQAVICVLGSQGSNTPIEAVGTEQILKAMQTHGVRRLIAVTSLGVGDSRSQINPVFRVIMDLSLKPIMQAKAAQEELIRASGLDWTIVRPGGLTNGPKTDQYQHGTDPKLKGGRISRADVAAFVLKQLTDTTYLHQTPAVT